MAFDFSQRRSLDLLSIVPILNALVERFDTIEAISFALLTQKIVYNCYHQRLFMNISK